MAQLGERLSAEREGLGLNPALTKNQGLLISQDHAGCLRRETLSRVTGGWRRADGPHLIGLSIRSRRKALLDSVSKALDIIERSTVLIARNVGSKILRKASLCSVFLNRGGVNLLNTSVFTTDNRLDFQADA